MTGRFIVLYSLPSPAGVAGAPVLISDGELLMDRLSEKLYIRVYMQSLDEREIHSAQVNIQLFDEVGAPVELALKYNYHSLKVERDGEFGKNYLIPVSSKNARSFSVYLTNVTFSDYSVWENSLPFQNFGKIQTLEEALENETLARQFEAQYGSDCRYMPSDETVIWYCVCGGINRADEERCHICRRKRAALQDVNYAAIESEVKIHAESEEKENEQLKKDSEEKIKKRNRLFKGALILFPILLIAILILSTVPPFFARQKDYRQAVELLKERKFDEAQILFESLGNYQDSRTQTEKEIPYRKALYLISAAEKADSSAFSVVGLSVPALGEDEENIRIALYEGAKELLEQISPYKDSDEHLASIQAFFDAHFEALREQKYTYAESLLEKGAYLRAREAFLDVEDYKDSADKAKECLYNRAVSLLDFCENNNVRRIFLDVSRSSQKKTLISMPGSVLTELGSDTVYLLKRCFVEDGVEFFYEDTPSGENYLPICDAVRMEFENLGEFRESSSFAERAQAAGDFSREFYQLLKDGNLEEATRWLQKYGEEVPDADAYIEWIDALKPLCSEWELSMGDSTLIPFSAGQEYTKLESFSTAITIDNNLATIHFTPHDGSYEASLSAEFGGTQFSGNPDGTVYYAYINQIGRLVYIRYTQNGAVLSSCEYNRG